MQIRDTIGTLISERTTGFAPGSTCLQDRRLSQSSHVGKHEREDSNPLDLGWSQATLPRARSYRHSFHVADAQAQPLAPAPSGTDCCELDRGGQSVAPTIGGAKSWQTAVPWSRRQIFVARGWPWGSLSVGGQVREETCRITVVGARRVPATVGRVPRQTRQVRHEPL